MSQIIKPPQNSPFTRIQPYKPSNFRRHRPKEMNNETPKRPTSKPQKPTKIAVFLQILRRPERKTSDYSKKIPNQKKNKKKKKKECRYRSQIERTESFQSAIFILHKHPDQINLPGCRTAKADPIKNHRKEITDAELPIQISNRESILDRPLGIQENSVPETYWADAKSGEEEVEQEGERSTEEQAAGNGIEAYST